MRHRTMNASGTSCHRRTFCCLQFAGSWRADPLFINPVLYSLNSFFFVWESIGVPIFWKTVVVLTKIFSTAGVQDSPLLSQVTIVKMLHSRLIANIVSRQNSVNCTCCRVMHGCSMLVVSLLWNISLCPPPHPCLHYCCMHSMRYHRFLSVPYSFCSVGRATSSTIKAPATLVLQTSALYPSCTTGL